MAKKILLLILVSTLCLFFSQGVALADERFTDNKDGTVTDHLLNVMWAKTDNQGNIDWHQANKWAKYSS